MEIVQNYIKKNTNIRLLSYEQNKGKGYAVRCGMLHATGDYAMYLDADGAISIDHLESFWDEIRNGHDIIIGSTELSGTVRRDDNAWYRKILGKLAKYLIRFIATPGIKDTQRAFKLFPRVAIQDIFKRQTIKGWGFDIEILVIAKKLKYTIKEVPVTWLNPSGSHQEGLKTYVLTLIELIQISTKSILGYYRRNSYPQIPTLSEFDTTLQGKARRPITH